MKFPFLLLLAGALATPAAADPYADFKAYRDRVEKTADQMRDEHRAELAKVIKSARRIELYLVDFETKKESLFDSDDEYLAVKPYGAKCKILKKHTLAEKDRAAFLDILSPTVGVQKNTHGAFCHFPVHGVRVYHGDNLLLETTFCWHCQNFFIQYPFGESGWVGLSDESTGLRQQFEKFLPIPKDLTERFERDVMGKGRAKEKAKGIK